MYSILYSTALIAVCHPNQFHPPFHLIIDWSQVIVVIVVIIPVVASPAPLPVVVAVVVALALALAIGDPLAEESLVGGQLLLLLEVVLVDG